MKCNATVVVVGKIIYELMPGVRCHAIQRNKYFVVYPANNYLLKCYGIHDIFLFFRIAQK